MKKQPDLEQLLKAITVNMEEDERDIVISYLKGRESLSEQDRVYAAQVINEFFSKYPELNLSEIQEENTKEVAKFDPDMYKQFEQMRYLKTMYKNWHEEIRSDLNKHYECCKDVKKAYLNTIISECQKIDFKFEQLQMINKNLASGALDNYDIEEFDEFIEETTERYNELQTKYQSNNFDTGKRRGTFLDAFGVESDCHDRHHIYPTHTKEETEVRRKYQWGL